MGDASTARFKTPLVREMTHAEYREQRRRVVASLVRTKDGARLVPSPAPRIV
jgi:hypothetical protein